MEDSLRCAAYDRGVSASRIASLDGVRGIAALIVLLHHTALLGRSAMQVGEGTLWNLLEHTPIKLALMGTEAVLVFFVLSGLVVTLPALRSDFHWPGYAVGRLARLYLPVWGALLLATVLVWLLPRDATRLTESWITERSATEFDWQSLLDQATLSVASYPLSNPIWSLRWELLFSVLLPVFVGIALLLHHVAGLTIGVAIVASVIGGIAEISWLHYLPVFLIGTMLAVRLDAVRTWAARTAEHRGRLITLAVLTALLLIGGELYAAPWVSATLPWTSSEAGVLLGQVLSGLAVAGAAGAIVLGLGWPGLARLLEGTVPQWLGKTSFSLYLVHVPILVTLAYAFGAEDWHWAALLGVPLSLAAGWLFWRAVERPAHRLARSLSGRARRLGAGSAS